MNKSLEFVRKRISSGKCSGMENNNYINWNYVQFNDYINQYTNFSINKHISFNFESESPKLNLLVKIKYDPNAKFEYFTMERCICDGTMYFLYELMHKNVAKIFGFKTYNKLKLPNDFFENKYNVEYTVGDFVFTNEHSKSFATENKPYLTERFTVMIPIKCDFIKKNTE